MIKGSIITIAILILFLIAVLSGLKRGAKQSWQHSAVRLTVTLAAAIAAIFIARSVAGAVARTGYDLLVEKGIAKELTDTLAQMPNSVLVIKAIATMIIALGIFYPVYVVTRFIFKLVSPLLVSLLTLITGGKKRARDSAESDPIPEEEEESILYHSDISEQESTEETEATEAEDAEPESTGMPEDEECEPIAKKPSVSFGKPIGIALSILASIIALIVYLAPITGAVALAECFDDTIEDLAEENESADMIASYASSVTDNTAVGAVNALGAKAIFNLLTTVRIGDEKASLLAEGELVGSIAHAILTATNDSVSKEDKLTAIDTVIPTVERSSILPIVVADLISSASSAWERGESFLGISLPEQENEEVSNLISDLLATFRNSTPSTVRDDMSTFIRLFAVVIDSDVTSAGLEDPMSLLENKKLVSGILYEILENARLRSLMSSAVDLGISAMTDALGIKKTDGELYNSMIASVSLISSDSSEEEIREALKTVLRDHGIDVTDTSLSALASAIKAGGAELSESGVKTLLSAVEINTDTGVSTVSLATLEGFSSATVTVTGEKINPHGEVGITDTRHEADALADAFASIPSAIDVFSSDSVSTQDALLLAADVLDGFTESEIIGKDCVDELVIALLQSDSVRDAISMDSISARRFAKAIIGDAGSGRTYRDVMSDISKTITALEGLSDGFNKESITTALGVLNEDTATALAHVISEDILSSIGFGGDNVEGVSNILSSVFHNISNSKKDGMTDAEFEAETDKVADLLEITMEITDDGDRTVSMESYVDSVMDSKIVTGALVDNVYGDSDTAKLDPLGTNTALSESEKESLVSSLQNKLDSAAEEDKEDTGRTVVAVAAYLNLGVEIIDGTVTVKES